MILFAGPSLPRSLPLPEGVTVLPPVRRGDLPALILKRRPGVIALADGLFHQSLAVGHVEIRDALDTGWQVWGLSSMGAIRACEMRHLGVHGFGQVYERFLREPDFQDDEVALLHSPDPPYSPCSEPLVHLRAALKSWSAARLLGEEDARAIAEHLKSLWYGDRTLPLFRRLVAERVTDDPRAQVEADIADFDRFRIKTRDLQEFLKREAWREA